MADVRGEEMSVQVRLFAILRERCETSLLDLRLRRGATVAEAMGALGRRAPLDGLLAELTVVMAVNGDYAVDSTVLREGDELALIPPVSGGTGPERGDSDPVHVRVGETPLDPGRAARQVGDARAGAIVVFQGVTREVAWLHYEAYVEMAIARIERIAAEARVAFGLCAVAVEHRTGDVATGEPSVVVAVSAAHRSEAFDGARSIIDRIKAEAPIWKREHDGEGTGRWLAGSEIHP